MGKHIHKIVEVYEETLLCRNCGVVPKATKTFNGKIRYQCSISVAEQKSKPHYKVKNHRVPGITHSETKQFKENKQCEACGNTENLKLDHDHKTKIIRGILCHWCNIALGMLKDDPERIKQLLKYLENTNTPLT